MIVVTNTFWWIDTVHELCDTDHELRRQAVLDGNGSGTLNTTSNTLSLQRLLMFFTVFYLRYPSFP